MLRYLSILAALLVACVLAVPAPAIKFDKRSGMPQITFPDATYQASAYDSSTDIYTFRNIRYAAPPVGELRWAKPAPAPKNSTIQDGSYGDHCPNAQANGINILGSLADIPLAGYIDDFVNAALRGFENRAGSEDCLFLDIYVPGVAVRNPSGTKLPVVHWFFGGGYVLGAKDFLQPLLPFYDGSGYLEQSQNQVIFVASNYRLGAFGWLAGSSMEAQGLPNAGLWDQRAALQWTKDNIGLIGGDPTDITAMGESAGASSLLHHLVFDGGKTDPIFTKAVLLSPAYLTYFDRRGTLDEVFHNFTQLAGCNASTVACLRAADSETLIQANIQLNAMAPPGTFMVGASPDGSLIRQTPALEFASGNYWKGLQSAIVSHVAYESDLFVDGAIQSDSELTQFLRNLFPPYAMDRGLDQAILAEYPSPSAPGSPYQDEGDRVRAIVRDSSFTCHARELSAAYAGKTWNMQYSLWPAWHATDLLVAFWTKQFSSSLIGDAIKIVYPNLDGVSSTFMSYVNSLIRTGDPNTLSAKTNTPPAIAWPHPDLSGENVTGVLNVGFTNSLIADTQVPKSKCDFWRNFLAAATIDGGYVPPGALVNTTLTNSTAGASDNYPTAGGSGNSTTG